MKIPLLPLTSLLLFLSVASSAQECNDRIISSTPDTRFSVSGDEVTDLQTGLIWQRCSVRQSWDGTTCSGNATTHDWSNALAMATGDWRLPNIKELASIAEIACVNPAVNLTVFPETVSGGYWSSSSSLFANYSDRAWYVTFGSINGNTNVSVAFKFSNKYVRLVRGGQ